MIHKNMNLHYRHSLIKKVLTLLVLLRERKKINIKMTILNENNNQIPLNEI